MTKARTHSRNAFPSPSSWKYVASLRKSTVMVRFARVGLAAVPICHPQVIRSRQRIRHDGGNAWKSQDHREGLRPLPLKAMECGKMQWTRAGAHKVLQIRGVIASNEWEDRWQGAVLSALE